MPKVALLAEGVDRNCLEIPEKIICRKVALLAEGVDRNGQALKDEGLSTRSPSSRRAWIEMKGVPAPSEADRRSPSSRRAWIEMFG